MRARTALCALWCVVPRLVAGVKSFYLVTLDEAEAARPELKRCGLNVYGAMTYYRLLTHYRRSMTQADAAFVFFPPYFTCEHNWPVYGGGSFQNNWARNGAGPLEKSECRRHAAELATTWKYAPDQQFVVHDGSGDWLSGHDFPHLWNVSNSIVAKGNALYSMYRPGRDVSMPPPMTENAFMYRHFTGLTAQTKKFLVAFKGDLSTHALRRRVLSLHNPGAGVIVVSKSDQSYAYDELMSGSHFSLVLHGHVPFSYRFSEAVCHDTIPVLVSDAWVPPFSEMVPFESYGVRIKEADVEHLVDVLTNMSHSEREIKRQNAMRLCYSSIITPYHQIDTLLRILFRRYHHL